MSSICGNGCLMVTFTGSSLTTPAAEQNINYIVANMAKAASIAFAVSIPFAFATPLSANSFSNDSLILMATGQAQNVEIDVNSADYTAIKNLITEVAIELAQAIVRDGEGATMHWTFQKY